MNLPPLTDRHSQFTALLLVLLSLTVLLGLIGSALALVCGIALALLLGNPLKALTQAWSGLWMKTAIVLMGFGLPLDVVWQTASNSFLPTVATIAGALTAGWWLTHWLKIAPDLGQLIAAGTAICGGSAIAAVAPVIKARSESIVIAVSVVFLLNALALLLFPPIGHWFGLSETQFGLWAALAIHDTSSVVGAGASYGPEALQVATTAKLARAVWIIPLVFFFAALQKQQGKTSWPTFIGLFLLASVVRTFVPLLDNAAPYITGFARHIFALSLFWIGAGLTRQTLQQISLRPLLMAIVLWLLLSCGSLIYIKAML